jgi:hypothetical protein
MRATSSLTLVAVAVLVLTGCAKEAAPVKTEPANSPEGAYRQLMLANLEGTEAKIRPLVLDQPGVETLWQGPYPADMAKLLAAQYQTMDIVRVAETPSRVSLKSTAAPTALDAVLDGQTWKIDPSPIIAFRKKGAK